MVIEGPDGAGKSLVAKMAKELLIYRGYREDEIVHTKEPGGGAIGQIIRSVVLSEKRHTLTEFFLMLAARDDNIQSVILPALKKGYPVICERFTPSTYVYQLPKLKRVVKEDDAWRMILENCRLAEDVVGAYKTIFIMPPNWATLRDRLMKRTDKIDHFDSYLIESSAIYERYETVIREWRYHRQADVIYNDSTLDDLRMELQTVIDSYGWQK